jgi:hypothetical protein
LLRGGPRPEEGRRIDEPTPNLPAGHGEARDPAPWPRARSRRADRGNHEGHEDRSAASGRNQNHLSPSREGRKEEVVLFISWRSWRLCEKPNTTAQLSLWDGPGPAILTQKHGLVGVNWVILRCRTKLLCFRALDHPHRKNLRRKTRSEEVAVRRNDGQARRLRMRVGWAVLTASFAVVENHARLAT